MSLVLTVAMAAAVPVMVLAAVLVMLATMLAVGVPVPFALRALRDGLAAKLPGVAFSPATAGGRQGTVPVALGTMSDGFRHRHLLLRIRPAPFGT